MASTYLGEQKKRRRTTRRKNYKNVEFQHHEEDEKEEEKQELIHSNMESLPAELILDILSRVPTLDLPKLRYVCRRWRNILKDPLFRPLHCSRSLSRPNDNRVLLLKRSSDLCFLDFTHKTGPPWEITIDMSYVPDDEVPNYEFVGSCNGLLCLGCRIYGSFIILNPFTRQYLLSPRSPCYLGLWGFGFDSVNNLFKVIVCMLCCRGLQVKICDVSCGGIGDWRDVKGTAFRLQDQSPACFVNGRLHWTHMNDDGSLGLISFDLADEEFGLIPIPHCLRKNRAASLIALEGNLCIFLNLRSVKIPRLQIWIMKEYGVEESWVKMFDAKPTIPRNLTSHLDKNRGWRRRKTFKGLGSVRDGEVWLKYTKAKFEDIVLSSDLTCGQLELLDFKKPLSSTDAIIHSASLNWV